MGEYGYDYVHSGASVLRVNVNMVQLSILGFWRKSERRQLRNSPCDLSLFALGGAV